MKATLNPFYSTPTAVLLGCLIIAISILMHGGIIKLGKPVTGQPTAAQPTSPSQPVAAEVEKPRDSDRIKGDKGARIVLIEYSDLQCPFCKSFHPTAQKAVDEYSGQVAWVYRHFPLDQIHPKARKLAEAVECAHEQQGNDGFWKLSDRIFEEATTPEIAAVPGLAAQVGLDQNKLKTCIDSGKMAAYVESDYQSGVKSGVNGTPGNFLYDTKSGKSVSIPGAVPFESLKTSIDSLLKS